MVGTKSNIFFVLLGCFLIAESFTLYKDDGKFSDNKSKSRVFSTENGLQCLLEANLNPLIHAKPCISIWLRQIIERDRTGFYTTRFGRSDPEWISERFGRSTDREDPMNRFFLVRPTKKTPAPGTDLPLGTQIFFWNFDLKSRLSNFEIFECRSKSQSLLFDLHFFFQSALSALLSLLNAHQYALKNQSRQPIESGKFKVLDWASQSLKESAKQP